jgi:hypothetical protein
MSDDIINPTSQVHRLAAGEFYCLWRGQGIRQQGGKMRLFNTRKAAWTFLARCDSVGRVIQHDARQGYVSGKGVRLIALAATSQPKRGTRP